MATDLETLRTDIEAYLRGSKLAIFRGFPGLAADKGLFFWNVDDHPDFRDFLKAAENAGVRLIVFNSNQFTTEEIEEAFERLQESELPRDEAKTYENRLRELQKYEGFTSVVELCFSLEGCSYEYRMKSDWYRIFEDTVLEVEAGAESGMDDGNDDMSGYFSKN